MLRRAVVVICLLFVMACTPVPPTSVPPTSAPPTNVPQSESSVTVEITKPTSLAQDPVPVPVASPEVATLPAAPETGLVLATDASGGNLLLINPADRESPVEETIVVGAAPWDVYVAAGQAFVSTAEGVAVVGLERRIRTALIPYAHPAARVEYGEYRAGGTGIVASADGATVYVAVVVAGEASVLEKIDVASGRVVDSVEVGLRPFDILLSDDGSEVYTIDHDSFSVHIVDTETLAARRIEVAPFGTRGGLASWEKPHYGAIDDDGNLLLPYQGQALAIVDPVTGEVTTEEMTANSHQHGTAYDDGTLLGIGTGAFGNATGSPNLTIRDAATNEERVVELGRLHETVVPWSDAGGARYALLSGGYTRDGFWPGITVVNLESIEQYELAIPGRPQALAVIPLP